MNNNKFSKSLYLLPGIVVSAMKSLLKKDSSLSIESGSLGFALLYLEDFKEGWEYALTHFIEEYKEAMQQQPKEEYLSKNKSIPSNVYYASSKRRFEEETNTDQRIKLISYLKCHYCNLDFHDVSARREHELEWHVQCCSFHTWLSFFS